MISKIANKILETRHQRGSVPNLKGGELAVVELKALEDCQNERREMRIFVARPLA